MATTSYRDAAIALWGDAGAYVHDAYRRWLHLYPKLPKTLPIVIGITAYGRCVGHTRTTWRHGPRITIASNHFKRGRLAVDDVMVHEMLHASLALTGQATDHDSNPWYTAVRRLSPAVLGHELGAQRGADRTSVRVPNPAWAPGNGEPKTLVRKVSNPDAVAHADIARWPQPFRPESYDWGEPIDCPSY